MSEPAPRAPRIRGRLASHAWWVLLAAALVILWNETDRRIDRVNWLTSQPTWSVDAPGRDAKSPTGYEGGQRRLIVPGHHNPSYRWIIEAQKSAGEGRWRLRHIDYDAAPDGRDIRRTAPYRWWLIAIGWVREFVSGETLGYAIGRGALVADPVLLGLLLTLGACYTAWYLGKLPAAAFVIGGVSLFPLAANFQPGAPDPHSLAWVLALGSVLPLVASRDRVGPHARAHFVGAGILGGIGIWNDSTTGMAVVVAVFLGALCHEIIRTRGKQRGGATPCSWRAWANAGAITTFVASLFEFAPHHMSWSLDAVSPIHAVVWWGMGEVLGATGLYLRNGRARLDRRSVITLCVAILAILSWPVAGILTDSGSLLASDFYARELANHPSGTIAPSLGAWLARTSGDGAKWATLLPCALLFVLVVRVVFGKLDQGQRGRLVFATGSSVFIIAMGFLQLRWWNLCDVFELVALAVLVSGFRTDGIRAWLGGLAAVVFFLPGLFVGFPASAATASLHKIATLDAQSLIERDYAYSLVKHAGTDPVVLFSTPIFSGAAAFYGGFRVVASSDDENRVGFLTAVRIASATTEQEVSILLHSRGITHVALPLWDPILDQLVRIGLDVPPGQELPQNAFSVSLRQWDMPLWMRPMDYFVPNEPQFQGFDLRSFALQAAQEPEMGLSRLADFFVDRGQLREARGVRDSLKAYPRSVVAIGAIARIDLALQDAKALKDSLEELIPDLSRRSARNLPADRRISLAALFIQTDHRDLARDQLTACFATFDESSLRSMTPSAVVNLVALSRSLDVPFPDPKLEAVAMDLVPPSVRGGLREK